jgi:predicted chitinase
MVQDELNHWHKYKKNPVNLVDHPEILRTNPSVAADASIAYWKIRVAPELKGKHADIKTASKMVNPAGHGAMDTFQRFAKELLHYKTPPKKHTTPKHK